MPDILDVGIDAPLITLELITQGLLYKLLSRKDLARIRRRA